LLLSDTLIYTHVEKVPSKGDFTTLVYEPPRIVGVNHTLRVSV